MAEEVTCLGSGLSPEEEKLYAAPEGATTFGRGDMPEGAEGVWSADYALATVRDIPSTAWSYANRPHDLDIDRIVLHFTAGLSFAPIAFGPGGLTPYGVNADGRVDQYINERYIAWHAANWEWNQHSIGIEHVGFGRPSDWTDAMLNASAKLTADICKRHRVAIDRTHIKGHSEIPGATHTDVGPNFPWSRYIDLVKKYAGGGDPVKPKKPKTLYLRTVSALPARKAIAKATNEAAAKKEQERLLRDHGIETTIEP